MGITSQFLSWDRPALASATEWLLKQASGGVESVIDLSHLIVVLPSAYAQRRLLRRLTEACHAADQALIPPIIQTVGALPEQLYEPKNPFASDLVQQLAWGETLRQTSPEELAPLIPIPPEPSDIPAWRDYGDTIRRVYRELASNGYTFEVVSQIADQLDGFAEHDRWEVLAGLQQRYLDRLDALELWDKQTARIIALQRNECRCAKRLVLIGAVDLNLTMRKMLDQVAAAGGDITALIVAPPELADRFDGHGCLIPEKWTTAQIELDWQRVHLVDGPAEQAEQVAGCLAELAGEQSVKQVVIGMPDEGLIGEVTRVLARHEVTARFGPGRPAAKSRPFQALEIVVQLATGGRYYSLAELWRHPDLFDALELKEPGVDQLDEFFNKKLPARVDNLKEWPEKLAPAIERLRQLTKLCPDQSATLAAWAETLRSILLAIYEELSIEVESPDHRHLARPLQAINKSFGQWSEVPEPLQGSFTATEAVDLLKRQLGRELISADVDPAAVEMVGWLDLPLDDAPCAIVTSVNEGILPSSTNSDLFLPNVLRERLGIDDNRSRLARDAYQMQVVRHTRDIVHWIVPKRNAQGDPVSPSRLLMACPDAELPARVLKLFGAAAEPSNCAIEKRELTEEDHHQRIVIPAPQPRTKPFTRISPTAIKLYLTCPYRFYLRYVAGLREMEDGSSELHGGAFGNLAHDVLCAFGESDLKDSTNPEAIAAFFETELERRMKGIYGPTPLPAVLVQAEQLRMRLARFAEAQAARAAEGWLIWRCELGVEDPYPTLEVDGEPIELDGRIDRVDYHPQTKQWVMWDYKTGDSVGRPEADHHAGRGEDRRWTSVQLPFYRHLSAHHEFRGDVELGYITLPKDLAEVGFRTAGWNESDLDEADEVIRHVVRQIRAQQFFPPVTLKPNQADGYSRICQDTVLGKWTASRLPEEIL